MLPSWLFALRILPSLIPKSFRAGVALVVTLVAFPFGLNELVYVLVGEAGVWTILRCVLGFIIGGIAGVVFYYFQSVDGGSKTGSDLELVAQYHKDRQKNYEVAWSSEDYKNDTTKND